MAGPFPKSSKWRINRDKKIDNVQATGDVASHFFKVASSTNQGNNFEATYTDVADDSVFTGEVHQRESRMIMVMQHNPTTQYWAVHAGRYDGSMYSGVWYDVAGNSGNFTIVKG